MLGVVSLYWLACAHSRIYEAMDIMNLNHWSLTAEFESHKGYALPLSTFLCVLRFVETLSTI